MCNEKIKFFPDLLEAINLRDISKISTFYEYSNLRKSKSKKKFQFTTVI